MTRAMPFVPSLIPWTKLVRTTCRFRAIQAYSMSTKSLTSSLPPPLRDLVAAACPNDEDFGSSDKDKAEIVNWIQQAASGSNAKSLEPKVTP